MLGHLLFITSALVNPLRVIDATIAYSFPSVLCFSPWYNGDWSGETIPGHPCLRTSTLAFGVGILLRIHDHLIINDPQWWPT
ncbi:hypothetical protein F5888DRAFT_1735937 [Russula emetica]|nr:hypothetical protein F5888DRAFT_1735937 [Russula emetica]